MAVRLLRACLLILALAAAAGVAAEPSLLGTTGLVQTPNTDTVQRGAYQFAGSYLGMDDDNFAWPIRLVAGLSDVAELGVAYIGYGDGQPGRMVNVIGKVALAREPQSNMGLALGADFGFLGRERFDSVGLKRLIRVYAVASKELQKVSYDEAEGSALGVRLDAGLAYQRLENGETATSTRPFFGVEFATRPGAVIAFEWRSEKYGNNVTSAVVRYPFKGYTTVELGVTNNLGGLGVSGKGGVFVGASWHFDAPD